MTEPDPEGFNPDFFTSEQDMVAERMAWEWSVEQGDEPPVTSTALAPVEQPQVADDEEPVDPPVDPMDIPDKFDLPMFGSVNACPKCGFEEFETVYHAAGAIHGPCGQTFGWPDVQGLGEHICITCRRCAYGLPMAVWHG